MKKESDFSEFLEMMAHVEDIGLRHQDMGNRELEFVEVTYRDLEVCTILRSRACPVYVENPKQSLWMRILQVGFKSRLKPETMNIVKSKHYGGWTVVSREGLYWIKGDTSGECFVYVMCWIHGRLAREGRVELFPGSWARGSNCVEPDSTFVDQLATEICARSELERIADRTLGSRDGKECVVLSENTCLEVEINGHRTQCECDIFDVGLLAAAILGELDGRGFSPDD